MHRKRLFVAAVAVVAVGVIFAAGQVVVSGQRGGGRGAAPQDPNLPETPTAVALPSFEVVTGPGAMYDSSPAQWPGHDMSHYNY